MCIAAQNSQIWIPEIEYYQKMSSHAQIRPQGAGAWASTTMSIGASNETSVLLWYSTLGFDWPPATLLSLSGSGSGSGKRKSRNNAVNQNVIQYWDWGWETHKMYFYLCISDSRWYLDNRLNEESNKEIFKNNRFIRNQCVTGNFHKHLELNQIKCFDSGLNICLKATFVDFIVHLSVVTSNIIEFFLLFSFINAFFWIPYTFFTYIFFFSIIWDIGGKNLVIKSVNVGDVRLCSPDLEMTSETFNLLRDQ